MSDPAAPVLVWDRETPPPDDAGAVLLWRSHAESPRAISVPAYLEANAVRVRAKYLAFVHELGESRIRGKSVVEQLALDEGFSYWWMTWLAEKSPFKSPGIYASLRLLALEEILRSCKPARLDLDSADDDLAEAMGALCANLGVAFVRRPGARRGCSLRDSVPHPLKGLLALLRFAATRSAVRRPTGPRWFTGDGAVFVCSFFAHLDAAACARGVFRSRYWAGLPERLHDSGRRTNWLHHYLPGYSSEAPDAPTSLDWLARFNADGERQGRHAFLESYLSVGVAFRAALIWLRLNAAHWRLRGIAAAFTPKDSVVWLWPVLREDWRVSMSGSAAALNCFWLELFDVALKDVPPQKTGLFLCEYQAWDAAFLRAWRRHGHGKIIGVAHATVPFWHLYYLDDPRDFAVGTFARPRPDRLAINGAAAARIMAEAQQPQDRIVEVEALRYLDLPRLAEKKSTSKGPRIIVLGDVIPESMHALLSALEEAQKLLPPDCRFTFKAHPLYAVDLSRYPGLRMERTSEALESVLRDFDVALAANSTSAAVDAYVAGLPVIIGLNGADLNLSPLRGAKGVTFVGGAKALADALIAAQKDPPPENAADGFYHLDAELPRWRKILEIGGGVR